MTVTMRRKTAPKRESLHERSRANQEGFVSHWFADYVEAGRAKVAFPMRNPLRTVKMLLLLNRLDRLAPVVSTDGDGPTVWQALHRPLIVRLLLGGAISAVAVPSSSAEYLRGRPMHALRQRVRAAEQAGVQYRFITDHAERAALMRLADEYERIGAVESMRNQHADNSVLVPLRLWLLAESAEGRPLLLAIAAVDGAVSVLSYYRTLTRGDESSAARYGAMPVLMDALASAHVRWLTETGRPHWIHNGVRQFQRKVGFRLVLSRPKR